MTFLLSTVCGALRYNLARKLLTCKYETLIDWSMYVTEGQMYNFVLLSFKRTSANRDTCLINGFSVSNF